ncbi:MAG: hypothetical protein LUH36_03365 [Oscillospiraceae bacterium]|nr:hypothetical protein [Oscillospiraceae bacterium]
MGLELRRLLIAAALFLAVSGMKWVWPGFGTDIVPAVQERLDRNQAVLYLPAEAVSWLDLD